MVTSEQVDFQARYRVRSMPGVAFRLKAYATTEEYDGDLLVCDDEGCDHQDSEMCWAEGSTSTVTDLDWVIGVMVGDDREHVIEVSDLEKIDDLDYCAECGQIGCAHDGRDRDE